MAVESKVQVISFTRMRDAVPKRGQMLLGYFDCQLAGVIELRDMQLHLYQNGKLIVKAPALGKFQQKWRRAAAFLDDDLFADIREAAAEAYERMGGVIEWPEPEQPRKEIEHV